MSEAAMKMPGSSGEKGKEPFPPGNDDDTGPLETKADMNGLIAETECFSQLSSDLKKCLSGIAHRIQGSMDEFQAVQKAVERKKVELKEIYDIEASAAALEKLFEEHQQIKAEFESVIENQRRLWEEEKALKVQEDVKFREAQELSRQREEEEYKRRWDEKRLTMRQKLEEELCVIQEKSIEKQKAIEADLFKREQMLKEKELEWVELIRELELFMTRLVARTRKDQTVPHIPETEMENTAMSINKGFDTGFPGSSEKTPGGEQIVEIEEEVEEDPKPSVASIREMLLKQGRRIENIHSNFMGNQDSVTFRVPSKKNL